MAEDIPRLVSIEVALNYLNDRTALTAMATYRRYDRPTLDRLQRELDKTGARVRGQIDGGRPDWIAEFMDYELTYRNFPVPGKGMVGIIFALSHHTYPAAEVKDYSAPVQGSHAVAPHYRLVVTNLEVETEALLPKVLAATSLAPGSPALDAPSIGSPAGGETEPAPDSPIVAAIKKRLANGECPASTVGWKGFSDSVRDDCDAWKYHKEKTKGKTPKRGFSDRQIRRHVEELKRGTM